MFSVCLPVCLCAELKTSCMDSNDSNGRLVFDVSIEVVNVWSPRSVGTVSTKGTIFDRKLDGSTA